MELDLNQGHGNLVLRKNTHTYTLALTSAHTHDWKPTQSEFIRAMYRCDGYIFVLLLLFLLSLCLCIFTAFRHFEQNFGDFLRYLNFNDRIGERMVHMHEINEVFLEFSNESKCRAGE